MLLSTHTSTCLAPWAELSLPPLMRPFESSIYQSQKSPHMKSYTFCTATPSSKRSRFSVISLATRLNLLTIHLSSRVSSPGSSGDTSKPSMFIWINRAAFQILLAKFRLAATFSSEYLVSLPGLVPVIMVRRRASAPYLSMTCTGSTPLPRDLDILRPWESRTRPWNSTVSKGISPICSMPENIMRATQKKMMS